jgi:hypothetical protein
LNDFNLLEGFLQSAEKGSIVLCAQSIIAGYGEFSGLAVKNVGYMDSEVNPYVLFSYKSGVSGVNRYSLPAGNPTC